MGCNRSSVAPDNLEKIESQEPLSLESVRQLKHPLSRFLEEADDNSVSSTGTVKRQSRLELHRCRVRISQLRDNLYTKRVFVDKMIVDIETGLNSIVF